MAYKPFEQEHIYPHLMGKTIKDVGKDGHRFYIQVLDLANKGVEEMYHIEWVNEHGETVKGEPRLVHRKDVRVKIVGAGVHMGATKL